MRSLNVTGAHAALYINGRPFGRVTDFQWNYSTPKRELRGIDVVEPVELAVTSGSISCTFSLLRRIADGGAEGAGMAALMENLPREKYFTVMLLERTTDTVLFRADFASVTSQSWSVPARGRVTGSISFSCLSWNNEVTPLQTGDSPLLPPV